MTNVADLEQDHRRLKAIVGDLCREMKSPQLLATRSDVEAELRRLQSDHLSLRAEWDHFRRAFEEKANFNPDQPRVSAGNSDGGQWTSEGGGTNDPRTISDATPANDWTPGAQYVQNRPRGPVLINGQLVEPTPGQAARLAVAEAQAQNAIRRVRDIEPNWRPPPSLYQSVEGLIEAHRADATQAEARLAELGRAGIGPGPFAGESIPARGPERDFTTAERAEINRIASETGCHTCGTFSAGTRSGNFIPDHQLPTALNNFGRPQDLYPQCASCSSRQGNWITRNRGLR